MNEVIRNVTDLGPADRRALEHVLGVTLADDQRVIVTVVNPDVADQSVGGESPAQTLDDWTHVYDGLSNQEVEAIDAIARTRADLTRDLP
jgi:hypothetical protein